MTGMMHRRELLAALTVTGMIPSAALASNKRRFVAAIQLTEARILIQTHLNGQGPFQFVLDTGAELSGVKTSVAQRLGLRPVRQARLNGRSIPVYAIDEMTLGGQLMQSSVALFDLEGNTLGGDGLVSAGMMTTYDCDLSISEGLWTVYPDGRVADLPGYDALPTRIVPSNVEGFSQRLEARAAIDEQALDLIIDTGSPWPVSLDWRSAERVGLLTDDAPFAPVPYTAFGRLHDKPGRLVRARQLTLGPMQFDNPLIFVRPRNADRRDELLGLPFLRTLDLSFRRPQTLHARSNGLARGEPRYGLSGLWLEERRGVVTVGEVGFGSPAAAAGIQQGDRLAGHSTLRSALDAIARPTGETVTLSLHRDSVRHDVSLTLAPYLSL